MDFLRKSLARKTFAVLFAVLAVLGCFVYFGAPFGEKYLGKYFVPAVLSVFFITAFIIIFLWIDRPLSKVFNEMKALLTGKTYKKIFTKRIDEVGVLAHFFNDVTKNIERISTDVTEGRRMAKELSVGSDIQRKILPSTTPMVPGLKIFGSTRPASEVGGDNWDIISAGPNIYMYVGDVTGHGLPAGLIMVMVNTLIRTFTEINTNSYDVLVNTNRLLKQKIEQRRFMTCVILRWNHVEQKLYYTGGGHEHILIFHRKNNTCEVKQTGGIALGMVPDISKIVKEEQIPLDPGDYIVLYTDGIVEAKNMEGEMFGIGRLQKTVEKYAATSLPEELFTRVTKDFAEFVGEQTQEDDITLIAIQRPF